MNEEQKQDNEQEKDLSGENTTTAQIDDSEENEQLAEIAWRGFRKRPARVGI